MKQLREHHYSCNAHISCGVIFRGNLKYLLIYLFIYLLYILVSCSHVCKKNQAF